MNQEYIDSVVGRLYHKAKSGKEFRTDNLRDRNPSLQAPPTSKSKWRGMIRVALRKQNPPPDEHMEGTSIIFTKR